MFDKNKRSEIRESMQCSWREERHRAAVLARENFVQKRAIISFLKNALSAAPGAARTYCKKNVHKRIFFFVRGVKVVRFTLVYFVLKPARRKMRFLPLIAATFFMVSGGPYGIEDILGGAGFGRAIVILLVLPFLWCLPTALMIGELAAALPAEGGFYTWVRRALGPFWGYQEGWLSLSASIFDMAIYPAIFVLYLSKFSPGLTAGWNGYAWSLAVVVLCCAWNLRGAPAVGEDSVALSVILLAPFAVFVVLGLWHGLTAHPVVQWSQPASESALSTAVLVAMWNYMGWDNASTVAQEVENPQKNYPRAMIAATILVAVTYILPLTAIAVSGLSVDSFTTGDWMTAATTIGGPLLGLAVVVGGAITGIGMFNALVMSYTRLPMAMAEDGMLPGFMAKRNRRGVPWVSVLLCGLAWALALKLPFERLISIDLILYGSSLLLEFVALLMLRLREPNLERPFKAGNLAIAATLGVGPAALIGYALYAARAEKLMGTTSALLFAVVVALLGPVLYWYTAAPRVRRLAATQAAD
jgi:amino acid transporter